MKKIVLPLLVLALTGVGYAYLVKTKPPAQALASREKTWSVRVVEVQPARLAPSLTLYARAESPASAELSAAVNAEVLAVHVREGQSVRRGQLLVQLDDSDARLLLQQREADLEEARAALTSEHNRHRHSQAALPHEQALLELSQRAVERSSKLERQQAASVAALDDSRRAVEQQQLSLNSRRQDLGDHPARLAQLQARQARATALRDQAKLELQRCQVSAPFDGLVSSLAVAPGERLRVGAPVLSLYAQDQLELRAQIPQNYFGLLHAWLETGQSVTGQSLDGQLKLRLARFAAAVDPASGGVDALFALEQGHGLLRLGQFVNLTLALPPQEDAVALPFEALYGNDQVYLLVEQDGVSRMRRLVVERLGEFIQPGQPSRVLVRSPQLRPATLVIVTHLPNALDGLNVVRAD